MSGISKLFPRGLSHGQASGFSLIEIILVLAIIGIMAAVAVPSLRRRRADARMKLLHELNALTQCAYSNALMTGKVHQLFFDFRDEPYMEVRIATGEHDAQAKENFIPIRVPYLKTRVAWDNEFDIKNFYIMGKDAVPGGTLKDTWFFIMPEGIAQSVIINVVDQKNSMASFVLNPFTVQFTLYDEFQKP